MSNHARDPLEPVALDDLVADVLARRPRAAEVFHARHMACPGCAMAPFMTVAEAAASYKQDPAELLAALAGANAAGDPTD